MEIKIIKVLERFMKIMTVKLLLLILFSLLLSIASITFLVVLYIWLKKVMDKGTRIILIVCSVLISLLGYLISIVC